jgi:pentatricopeptide repeat protein
MTYSIGKTIRRLRKERGFTQEELAEQLNITAQAISRWENETGMPDVSQIVPLAEVFGVSTDVLFGISDMSCEEEIYQIIMDANAQITSPATRESVRASYDVLIKGLERHPNNMQLLMQCLERGIALAYPENHIHDSENGQQIYKECIRQAKLVITYSNNTTYVLIAHMVMVMLHASYGNFESAREHARKFPWRADMTLHEMNSLISHFEKDYQAEAFHSERHFFYLFEAMLDDMMQLALSYERLENYADAEYVFCKVLHMIETVCDKENVFPSFHMREFGDVYACLANICLKQEKIDDALSYLKKMVEFDTVEQTKHKNDLKMQTPLLRDVDFPFYWVRKNPKKRLLDKLLSRPFVDLREHPEFVELLEMANSLAEE